jgi:hypothetical protein
LQALAGGEGEGEEMNITDFENFPNLIPQYFRTADIVPADGCETVNVLAMGPDEWSAQKAIELIAAARQMYDAIGILINAIVAAGVINDGTIAEAVLNAERAEVAACGGTLAREQATIK